MQRARFVMAALLLPILFSTAGPVLAQEAPRAVPARPGGPVLRPSPGLDAQAPFPGEAPFGGISGGVPGGVVGGVPGEIVADVWQDKPGSTLTPDEEVKAMALNALRNANPESAVPVLDKFLQADHPLKLKSRALSILCGFGTKDARAVVSRVAHDESNADLQMAALRALGQFEGEEVRKELLAIYASTKSADVKKTIIRILAGQEDVPGVMSLLRAEADTDLKGFAIRQLGALQAREELRRLFTQEKQEELRLQILRAMEAARDAAKIAEVARLEPVAAIRGEAIRRLSSQERDESGKLLADLYANEKDMSLKKEILRGLVRAGNIQGLIALARVETDPELKRYAVELLSRSRSKEASDFLVELLNK